MAPRRYTAAHGFTAQDLLVAARDHWIAAKCLLGECRPFGLDSAGYLLHMSAELTLKAWLLHRDGEFTAVHDVTRLAAQLQSRCSALADGNVRAKLKVLDGFNELRYPAPKPGRSISEPEARDLLGFVSGYLFGTLLSPEIQALLPSFYPRDKDGRFKKGDRFLMVKRVDKEPPR